MLLEIGVLLIGIAFFIAAIFVSYALNNLAGVLRGVEKTVEQVPDQMNAMVKETTGLIKESNHTLEDINDKMKQLSPLFYVVGDVGNVTRKFSSSLVQVTESLKNKSDNGSDPMGKKKSGSLYGSFTTGYDWLKKRRQQKKQQKQGAAVNNHTNN
ncbi:hypothetical protein J32TS6_42320 [Virgibacillus pantothenticus]|uniref:General stress protein n=1 Tax=Virgibacillus pantothenticus TaxID=1473 RepID=A0A0L0QVP3_VIRPA|nr:MULTISPECIES: DUF948 domain-containing protein [Virgibacillus]API92458.1 general stress protein [Virgibacillus sp. 6R]KNE22592.1 general stress protein [Virgibacillus pantothenticus]MBS7427291.1 DUF948 domain-containing protein [Virgibacillus sp. 19R1-5]MBU8567063.1 DUF948 domain-containing protein [Virgibacillus pantothenticus]MBU8601988.1 DUF948 domain-containing protein [Virgibacillus pantothenticus]